MNTELNIQERARAVLMQESAALQQLASYIDHSFEACVQAIYACQGRVVVSGIGKSAHIGQKIVATLNSTGTPAMFLHAAEAIHGDLGMVQPDDFVICISKSGNTPEIKVLVPLLKRTGAQLAALVSNTQSYLAQQAHFVLNGTIAEEACPNNLAPTTSTTAHLALGDALAVCLMYQRGFGSRDFARYHPGGALGKQLYLKVEDVSDAQQVPVVGIHAPITEVIVEISAKRLGATAVVNEAKQLVGIITDGDLRRMMAKHQDFKALKAQDIMSGQPKTVPYGAYAVNALAIMQENNISQVIMLQNEQVAGFVHLHDLLREGLV